MARALALGFLIGFPIAASPGPMFFLVLRRTLSPSWRNGVISGLGVATGDAAYAALAAFGVAAITNVLVGQRRWIALVGGITVALIGLRTLRLNHHPDPAHAGNPATLTTMAAHAGNPATLTTMAPPEAGEGNKQARGVLLGIYGSMVALTLGNPATIVAFVAVFAGLEVRVGSGWQAPVALVVGVLLGSSLWWIVMTAVVSILRERLNPAITHGIGLTSGLALIAFGVLITLQSL